MTGASNPAAHPHPVGASRFRCLAAMTGVFLLIGAGTRLALFFLFPADFTGGFGDAAGALALGAINDCASLVFALALPMLVLMAPSDRFLAGRAGRALMAGALFLFVCVAVFTAFAEYFFWDEFHCRFNFIAVDYLIYTNEVLNNIVESYPLAPLLGSVGLISLALTMSAWKGFVVKGPAVAPTRLLPRLSLVGLHTLAAVFVFLCFTPSGGNADKNFQEAGRNGLYELFSAFRHNTLDYRAFYPQMDREEAFRIVRAELAEPEANFVSSLPEDLRREMAPGRPESRPNVIVVVMESFGSKWLGEYSPNLVRLAGEGLSFSNMRSTGTRTVRGLEAITLSLPPTPGNSIVRRPDNGNLFSIGTVFKEEGYAREFIYGGYGYFDNMNAFFAGNGYTVVDRTDFPPERKTFATAWGQCDEDLFGVSLDRADAAHAAGTPFHQVVLTTSNHRPFTYPYGKVSIPPGDGRRGAVQYCDYAVGRFIEEAKKKPWFDNTVFVFVGDHPSAVAGKTYVPADGYGIACIFYAPKLIRPQKVDTLCSQIDVAPTLFALLGWGYRSQFFGRNVLDMRPEEGRAWISTYQLLGYLDTGGLALLRPAAGVRTSAERGFPAEPADPRTLRAIAFYQCAYDLFAGGKLKEHVVLRVGVSAAATPGP